jgi:hypothetical protein
MPTKETVTAQDFHDVIPYEKYEKWYDDVISAFDTLLSKARQQAFQEGRLQGLKEMDKAWEELDITESGSPIGVKSRKRARLEIASLRYEYQ